MADETFMKPGEIPDFVQEAEEAMAKGEVAMLGDTRDEVTIKFGKGLVGDPFTSKNGKELVEVSIPNADRSDTRPWESFVVSPKMIHDNKFGKGVWMKLPADGTTHLSRRVKTGVDQEGKPTWGRETREVTNAELKSLMESYKTRGKDSVLGNLSQRQAEPKSEKSAPKKARTETAR